MSTNDVNELVKSIINMAIATDNHPYSVLNSYINTLQTIGDLPLYKVNSLKKEIKEVVKEKLKENNLPWRI